MANRRETGLAHRNEIRIRNHGDCGSQGADDLWLGENRGPVLGVHRLLIQSGREVSPRIATAVPDKSARRRERKETILDLPTEWYPWTRLVLGWLIGDGWLRSGDKNLCRVSTFARNDASMFRDTKTNSESLVWT